eukprot:scpid110588/ scgid33580/ 
MFGKIRYSGGWVGTWLKWRESLSVLYAGDSSYSSISCCLGSAYMIQYTPSCICVCVNVCMPVCLSVCMSVRCLLVSIHVCAYVCCLCVDSRQPTRVEIPPSHRLVQVNYTEFVEVFIRTIIVLRHAFLCSWNLAKGL